MAKKLGIAKIKLFEVLAVIIILAGIGFIYLLQSDVYLTFREDTSNDIPFEIDNLLIKLVLRERDSISREMRVMNIDKDISDFSINIVGDRVKDIIHISENKFSLKSGQNKVILLNFTTRDETKEIEFQPGIYIGKIEVSTANYLKSVPVIVEIESRNVLFDLNINPSARDRKLAQDSSTPVEIRLFNLQGIDPVNIELTYFIKDLNDNTIITEAESVVVKTQSSFYKTINIPKNIRVGEYIFLAYAKYGGSVGTGSYLFEVVEKKPETTTTFFSACRLIPFCSLLLFFVVIVVVFLLIFSYLFHSYVIKRAIHEDKELEKSKHDVKEESEIPKSKILTRREEPQESIKERDTVLEQKKLKRELEIFKRKEVSDRRKKIFAEKIEKLKTFLPNLLEKIRKSYAKKYAEYLEFMKQKWLEKQGDKSKKISTDLSRCKLDLEKSLSALSKGNVKKASHLYSRACEGYNKLRAQEKKLIYDDFRAVYNKLKKQGH